MKALIAITMIALIAGVFYLSLIAGAVLLIFLFVYFRYAGSIFLNESEGVALGYMGSFQKSIILWQGHIQDEDYNIYTKERDVIDEKEDYEGFDAHLLEKTLFHTFIYKKGESEKKKKVIPERSKKWGGLVLFFYPLFKPFHHDSTLTGTHAKKGEGGEEDKGSKKSTKISLRPQQYESKITKAETSPRHGRIEIDFKYLIEIRIINIFKYLFVSPDSSIDNFLSRVDAWFTREFFPLLGFDASYRICNPKVIWNGLTKEGDEETWKEYRDLMNTENDPDYEPPSIPGLKDSDLIKKVAPQYGLKVSKESITQKELDASNENDRLALSEKRRRVLFAEAEVSQKEGERKAASEIMKIITDTRKNLEEDGYSPEDARNKAYEVFRPHLAGKNYRFIEWKGGSFSLPEIFAGISLGQEITKGKGEESSSVIKETKITDKERRDMETNFWKGVSQK